MTPNEAIRRIIDHIEIHFKKEPFAIRISEALYMGCDALKKQIPKKPDFEGDGYDDGGNLIYDTWICPCCETKYEVDYEHYKHCPECGQKIDWSEDDE